MPERNGFPDWSPSRTVVARRPDLEEDDVVVARRGAASFGGGDPTLRDLLRDFVRRYGWRAYALPVLVVVTVAALLTARTGTPPDSDANAAPPPTGTTQQAAPSDAVPPIAADNDVLKQDNPSGNSAPLTKGALPAGADYTMAGDGTFKVLPGTSPKVGTGQLYRYEIEVENGISGVDTAQFASMVQQTLADKRSWSGHGVAVQRVDSGDVDFHISLTSPMTVRKYCGYTIKVESSCYASAYSVAGLGVNRVFMNLARWVRGAAAYVGDLHAYRLYMINHENGHAMGHNHAHQCLPNGLAPAMMQQTFGLTSAETGKNCEANPWPYPPGVSGAPGAEQADTDANNEYYIAD